MQFAAASGFIVTLLFVTLLFVILSIFRAIRVENESSYSWKIAGGVVIANALGWIIYRAAKHKAEA